MLGIISDTHGLLRPGAIDNLHGSEIIIHAGDVNRPEILEPLKEIAPLFVVRGNVDRGEFGLSLPKTEVVEYRDKLIYVVHDIADLKLDPKAAGFDAVIYGHSHHHSIERRDGVIFFNPGSAGPRRFKLPVTTGLMRLIDGDLVAELRDVELKVEEK